MIKEMFEPGAIDRSTKAILLNALYFKGSWVNQFDKSSTNWTGEFHLNGTKGWTVVAKMMHQKAKFHYAVLDKSAKVLPTFTGELELNKGSAYGLRMPYKGKQMDMVFILPENSKDLGTYEKKE